MGQLDADEDGDDDSDEDQEITHSVPFKCIGAAHEQNYQQHLELAYLALKEKTSVKVHLRAEPFQHPLMDSICVLTDIFYLVFLQTCKLVFRSLLSMTNFVDFFLECLLIKIRIA